MLPEEDGTNISNDDRNKKLNKNEKCKMLKCTQFGNF